jgi:hypothetical protein
MKLREGHAGEAHKKRAEAARAKRFGAGAGAGSGAGAGVDDDEDDGAPGAAAGVVTGLTAFLTADWDGDDGVYSDGDGDEDDGRGHAIVPIPAFADTIAVLKRLVHMESHLTGRPRCFRPRKWHEEISQKGWCISQTRALTPPPPLFHQIRTSVPNAHIF